MPQNVIALDLGRASGCPVSENFQAVLTSPPIGFLMEVRNDLSSGRGSAKLSAFGRPCSGRVWQRAKGSSGRRP